MNPLRAVKLYRAIPTLHISQLERRFNLCFFICFIFQIRNQIRKTREHTAILRNITRTARILMRRKIVIVLNLQANNSTFEKFIQKFEEAKKN